MADTFDDLDALAASGPDGILWRRGLHWTYAGAPTNNPPTSNIIVSAARSPDGRVQAAMAAGAWVAAWIDNTTAVTKVLAVVKAPADGSAVRARPVSEFGRPA